MADESFCFKGRVIKSFANDADENNPIIAACVSPGDDTVFSCHRDKVIAWSFATCDRVGTLEGPKEGTASPLTACSIATDLMVTGQEDGIVHLWRYNVHKRVARIGLPLCPIVACAISPNGRCLAVAYADAKPRVYTIHEEGSLMQGPDFMELSGHNGKITDMVFSSCSYNLLTTSSDGTIKMWKVISGECLVTIDPEEGPVLGADFSGGSNICYLTKNGISVYHLGRVEVAWKIEGEFKLMACSNASHAIAAVTHTGRLSCYNAAEQRETVKKGTAHSDEILTCVLSSSGRHFLTGGADGKLFLWE